MIFLFLAFTLVNAESPLGEYAGSGNGKTREQALLNARLQAVQNAMSQEKKDPLFMDILLSQWPEAVRVVSESADKGALGMWTAKMSISLGSQEMNLALNAWAAQATSLLDEALERLAASRDKVAEAGLAETNQDLSAAWVAWNQARRQVDEALEIMKAVRSSQALSGQGLNPDAIRQQAQALSGSIISGLGKLQEIQRRLGAADENKALQEALVTSRTQVEDIRARLAKLGEKAPFFDLLKTDVDAAAQLLLALRSEIQNLNTKLDETEKSLLPEQSFFKTQAGIIASDLSNLDQQATLYHKQALQESRDPRIQRQARAEAAVRSREAFGRFVSTALWHKNSRTLQLKAQIPVLIGPMDGTSDALQGEWLELELQRLFSPMWLRTSAGLETWPLVVDSTKEEVFRQEVDFAFRLPILLGAGYGWDWYRLAQAGDGTALFEPLPRQEFSLHFGSAADGKTWPASMLSLRWVLPVAAGADDDNLILNGSLRASLALDEILDLEVSAWRRYQQIAETGAERFRAISGLSVSAALSYFGWVPGLGYRIDWTDDGILGNGEGPSHSGWFFTLAYAL